MALCQNLFFFLSCPGAIKRMQNGLFSMHSKMPCCIIIFGKKSSIWIEGLLCRVGLRSSPIFKATIFHSKNHNLRVCDNIHNFPASDSYTGEINESFQIEIRNPLKCRVVLFKVWMRKIQGPHQQQRWQQTWKKFWNVTIFFS